MCWIPLFLGFSRSGWLCQARSSWLVSKPVDWNFTAILEVVDCFSWSRDSTRQRSSNGHPNGYFLESKFESRSDTSAWSSRLVIGKLAGSSRLSKLSGRKGYVPVNCFFWAVDCLNLSTGLFTPCRSSRLVFFLCCPNKGVTIQSTAFVCLEQGSRLVLSWAACYDPVDWFW